MPKSAYSLYISAIDQPARTIDAYHVAYTKHYSEQVICYNLSNESCHITIEHSVFTTRITITQDHRIKIGNAWYVHKYKAYLDLDPSKPNRQCKGSQ